MPIEEVATPFRYPMFPLPLASRMAESVTSLPSNVQWPTRSSLDDFLDVTDLDVEGDLTITTWFKKPITEKGSFFISLNGSGVGGGKIGIHSGGGATLLVRLITNPPGPVEGPSDISVTFTNDGNWRFFVLTRDENDKVDVYFDGGSAQRLFSDDAQVGTVRFSSIGGHEDNTQNFEGQIDDVRIYDRKLTNEEIRRLYELGR